MEVIEKRRGGGGKNGKKTEEEIKQKHVHQPGQLVQSESAGVAICFV